MDTKQKILDISLKLFSQKGFTAVSVRDICSIVGVKESAIYYFFKNKKEILDTLTAKFLEMNKNYIDALNIDISQVRNITNKEFLEIINHYLEDYLMGDFVNSFLRILIIEQGYNEELRILLHKVLFDEPVQYQSKIFAVLIELGYFKKVNPEYLALSFYSPVLYYFQKYLIGSEMTKEAKDNVRKAINTHIDFFLQQYSEVHYE
ncbi:MAG: TetR/AcrR family transcriptional regulator [Lachnospiraceae bacterium]